MSNSSKLTSTAAQLRSLMDNHTNRTFSKPAEPTPQMKSAPVPPPVMSVSTIEPKMARSAEPLPAVKKARDFGPRYSVVVSPAEADKLNSLALELHHRLGKRVSMVELFRVALARINPNAPITGDELDAIRALDRRRVHTGRAGSV